MLEREADFESYFLSSDRTSNGSSVHISPTSSKQMITSSLEPSTRNAMYFRKNRILHASQSMSVQLDLIYQRCPCLGLSVSIIIVAGFGKGGEVDELGYDRLRLWRASKWMTRGEDGVIDVK